MSYQNEHRSFEASNQIILSTDGYVRMSVDIFIATPIEHLISGLDVEYPVSSCEEASVTDISGYTEWVSPTKPGITIGWDWQLDFKQMPTVCVRVGEPRFNVMLVDGKNNDLGYSKTCSTLEASIDALAWQHKALKAIGFQNL